MAESHQRLLPVVVLPERPLQRLPPQPMIRRSVVRRPVVTVVSEPPVAVVASMVTKDASVVVYRSMESQAQHRSAVRVRQVKRDHQAMVRKEDGAEAVAATVAALVVVVVVVEMDRTVPAVPFAFAAAAPAGAV